MATRAAAPKGKPAEKAVAASPKAAVAAPKAAAKTATPKGNASKAAAVAPDEAPVERGKGRAPGSDISPKVIHLIAEEMAVEEAELTSSASFRDDLSLDEIDVAELLVRAEETFGLKPEFDDEEWDNCQTVGDLIQLVENRVAAGKRKTATGHATGSAGTSRPRKSGKE